MSLERAPLEPEAEYQGRSRRQKATFALLLALSMAVSTMAVPAFSVLSRFLLDDFAISRTQFGWLAASVSITAGALSPMAGRLSDRFGGRRMILALFTLGGLVLIGLGAAPTFLLLVGVAVLAGVMNAISNPATNRLIASVLPTGKRGLIMGIKQSGVPAGFFLVGIALAPLALALGWRTAVAIASIVPLAGLVSAWATLPRDVHHDRLSRAGIASNTQDSTVTWLVIYAFLMGAEGSVVTAFLPLYLQESLGWGVALAGATLAGIGALGVGARVFWSWWAERSGQQSRMLLLMSIASFLAVIAFWAGFASDILIWIGVALIGGVSIAWNAVVYLIAIGASGGTRPGHASGLTMLGFMAGNTVGPVGFGYTVDLTGQYHIGWSLVLALLAAAILEVGLLQQRR